LEYFEEDDVLVDSRDSMIDNKEYMIGENALERFGYLSGDPNVVYVRNERLGMDFEIVKHKGARYAGGDIDEALQHSHRRPMRRFRNSDE
jgi:hypothetical protein